MPLYITVREGPAADRAEPLLATGDERVVRAVLDALAHIMFETATSSWAHRRRNAPSENFPAAFDRRKGERK
jgi:hypothetical protein